VDKIFLTQLEIECIIGIFKRERTNKQTIWVDLEIPCHADLAAKNDRIEDTVNYKRLAKCVLDYAARSKFFLVETLADRMAQLLLKEFHLPWITLTLSKPGAIRHSKNVGLTITRYHPKPQELAQSVFLGWGSNLKKSWSYTKSMKALEDHFDVIAKSSVYETKAVGMKGPDFWNSAIHVTTELDPQKLKQRLISIERSLGRRHSKSKFVSRICDFDILFYNNEELDMKGVTIPHADTYAQSYVLVPMAEIAPRHIHPSTQKSMIEMVAETTFDGRIIRT